MPHRNVRGVEERGCDAFLRASAVVIEAELTPRRQQVLSALIEEHVRSASPVSSEMVLQARAINVSSATVRNEMAVLEDLGLIYQPHTSAGRVPSELGYRYYVAHLMGERLPSPEEQRTIQHQFFQVAMQLQEWLQLAVSIIARNAQNAAIASASSMGATTLRRVEIVSLHEAAALVIVISRWATVTQQIVALEQPAAQENLSALSVRLSEELAGKTAEEVRALPEPHAPIERAIRGVVADQLGRQQMQQAWSLYHDGLAHLLSQPEFARAADYPVRQERMRALVDVIERGEVVRDLVPQVLSLGGVQVLIGEQRWDQIRDCTVMLAPYGGRSGKAGVIGVVGPTRMDYPRTMGVLRYVSAILSAMVDEAGVW